MWRTIHVANLSRCTEDTNKAPLHRHYESQLTDALGLQPSDCWPDGPSAEKWSQSMRSKDEQNLRRRRFGPSVWHVPRSGSTTTVPLKTLRPVFMMKEREDSADRFRGKMRIIFLKTVQVVSVENTLQSAKGQVLKPGSHQFCLI